MTWWSRSSYAKLLSNTYRYVHLSNLVREASLCNRWWLTRRPQLVNTHGIRDRGVLSHKWDIWSAHNPLQRLGIISEERVERLRARGGSDYSETVF